MAGELSPEVLVERLRWRYAVKRFDPSRKISNETWDALEQSLVLTPSSFGLQPWKFIVITDQKTKEALRAYANNQAQVTECSHLLVCTIKNDLGEKELQEYMESFSATRSVALEALDSYKKVIESYIGNEATAGTLNHWSSRQVYIALGFFMTAAALLGVDTCPLEGFNPEKFDEVLHLKEQNLKSIVLCPAGYRSEDDRAQHQKKIRFDRSYVIQHRS